MPHTDQQRTVLEQVLEVLSERGLANLADAFRIILNEVMKIERSHALAAEPWERTEERKGYANGFKPKTLRTRVGEIQLAVPQVRGLEGGFYPKSLERGVRSERALKLALAEMYVQGVSTRKVAEITQELCGYEVTSTEVSRAAQALDEELEAWRTRALAEVRYLLLDARYEKVRHGGAVVDASLLIAVGVLPSGHRCVLGTSVSLSEAEVHWREFLQSLQSRGMHGVRMVTSDEHAGLRAALRAQLTGVPHQRCQTHLQRNATAYVPRVSQRPQVAADIRSVFDSPDTEKAERMLGLVVQRWTKDAPKLAAWMEENLPQGLTVLTLPPAHRRRLRTTNVVERLNQEVKRRTAVVRIFPNEAALLRLATAVLAEVSEEWETGRKYLTMEDA